LLGRADYPALDQVREQIQKARGNIHYLDPEHLPLHENSPVPPNAFVLGAAVGHTGLGDVLDSADVANTIQARWKRGVERNLFAFQSGLDALS
jgi:hypothetical protein